MEKMILKHMFDLFLFIWCFVIFFPAMQCMKPNIVFIVSDDMGWHDVSFLGPRQFLTPNIDALANTGLAFERYYSHCVCTPSRTALLTGKYAYTLGMQGTPLKPGEDRGIPMTEKLMPQYFKELGYKTHLVGKWHVGSSRIGYLPTSRVFDSHFGHRDGNLDYYQYDVESQWSSGTYVGLTVYKNMTPACDQTGYITDVYTDEAKKIIQLHDTSSPLFLMAGHAATLMKNGANILQAPHQEIRAMRHIVSPERRVYAAMVKKLDDTVGEIFEALFTKKILNNTILIFVSDNGGMTDGYSINYAVNLPLRGEKTTPFEGGVRVPGLIWTSKVSKNKDYNKWSGYMHVTDWLPTLLTAAGGETPEIIDGIDQWENFMTNKSSSRNTFYEIDDDMDVSFESVTVDRYKLVVGGRKNGHSGYFGEELLTIKGDPPSYNEAIVKSKVFKVLEFTGELHSVEDFNLSDKIKVKCPIVKKTSIELDDFEENYQILPKIEDILLFDILADPCETTDLSDIELDKVEQLQEMLALEMTRVVPRNVTLLLNPAADPSLHNYTWTTWADYM